jgi:hypothetical protein
VGTLNLLVPKEQEGTFYIRKVAEVPEALCGTTFSKSLVGAQ